MENKEIGKVVLDYTYYDPEIKYSDGAIEDEMLEAAQKGTIREKLFESRDWAVLYHFSDIRCNILEWYPFDKNGSLLEIGSGCGALTGMFAKKVKDVTCIELSEKRSMINAYRNMDHDNIRIVLGSFENVVVERKYDYITLIGVWEYAASYMSSEEPYKDLLKKAMSYLRPGGKIFIAIENKMGLKYWNGASEDHAGKPYVGLNDYIDEKRFRTFSRNEIINILSEVGIRDYKFYYPEPDYKLPKTIYSDFRLPVPTEIRNYRRDYDKPRIYNFNDAIVADQLCSDGMYHYFANSFLIECGGKPANVVYAKINRNRREELRTAVVISQDHNSNKVERFKTNPWGDSYVTEEYIQGASVETYLYKYRNDLDLFLNKSKYYIDRCFDINDKETQPFHVTDEFRRIFGDSYRGNGESLSITNIDRSMSNAIIKENGEVVFIDTEWVFKFPIPYEYTKWRALDCLYNSYYPYLKNQITRQKFFLCFGINEERIMIYRKMENQFQFYVYGHGYLEKYVKPATQVSILTIV